MLPIGHPGDVELDGDCVGWGPNASLAGDVGCNTQIGLADRPKIDVSPGHRTAPSSGRRGTSHLVRDDEGLLLDDAPDIYSSPPENGRGDRIRISIAT